MSNIKKPHCPDVLAGSPPCDTLDITRRPVSTGLIGFMAQACRGARFLWPSLLTLLAVPASAAEGDCVKNAPFDDLARAALRQHGAPEDVMLRSVDEIIGGNHDNVVRDRPFRYWYRDTEGKTWAVQLTAHRVIAIYPP